MRGKIPAPAPLAVQVFEELTPPGSGIVVKKVFGQPAAFVNGNMFMGVFGDKLFVRLSEEACRTAMEHQGLEAFEPMAGRPMRGYVVLPRGTLADRAESAKWVAQSLAYAERLPGKTPKRKTA